MDETQGQSRNQRYRRSTLRKPPWVFRHARKVLFGFFAVCMFLNAQWVGNFGPTHIAIALLFAAGCLGWAQGRRHRVRYAAARHRNLFYWITGGYFLWRLVESRQNVWFLSDVAKLVLILVAVAAYWMFDRSNSLFPFVCRTLPKMLALAIALTIVQLAASGEILKQRLGVPALGWAPELAFVTATTLALHLYALKERPKMLGWYIVLGILLAGQLLAFQKDGVLAAAIILAFFLHSAAARLKHRAVQRRIIFAACLLVPFLLAVGIASLRVESFSVGERFSVENARWSLGARTTRALAWTEQTFADGRVLFGVGLGAMKPYDPASGWVYRDPDNVYVDVFGDFGLAGLVLYCGLLVTFWKRIAREPDELRRTLLQGIFWVYVASGFTGSMWRHGTVTWHTAYLFYLFAVPRVHSIVAIKHPVQTRFIVRPHAPIGPATGRAISI
jgi:hypothetical protein